MTARIRRVPVQAFNRACLIFALLWLAISIPVGIRWRPTMPDFGQFYIGGILVSEGKWNSLYPIPITGSYDNAGLILHSNGKSEWKKTSKKHGVADYTHFILPPPSALLFVPFSWLSYTQAYWTWIAILTLCSWGVAWVAGRLFREIRGSPSRYEGALALLIALSPVTARAIRIGNVSPPIALLLGLALLALVRQNRPLRGAWAILTGATLKYATLVLAPLLFAMRRWSALLWLSILGSAMILATVYVAGIKPFVEFHHVIMPTLSRPSIFPGNQSLPGMLARIHGRPFSNSINIMLNTARFTTFGAILVLTMSIRPVRWRDPINVFAAAGVLLSWLLIFSPIAWEHWPIFLCPIWGWLLWEARDPGIKRVLALASLALMYFPAGIIQVGGIATYPVVLPEPFNSSQLLGLILLLGLCYWHLSDVSKNDSVAVINEIVKV